MTVDPTFNFWERFEAVRGKVEPIRSGQLPAVESDGNTHAYAAAALSREVAAVSAAEVGTRNHTLNVAAFNLGQLVAAGHLAAVEVENALNAAARSVGLGEKEIAATIASGLRSSSDKPRNLAARPGLPELPTIDVEAAKTFWGAREVLEHVFASARGRRACPYAVLGVVLARVVTATPVIVVLPPLVGGEASLNLFVGLVGPSGSGKGTSERAATNAVVVSGVTTANPGSGEGIAHMFARRERGEVVRHRESVLVSVAEIDTLAAIRDRKASTLMPELRKAWSGEDLGFSNADPTRTLPIPAHTYRLTLVAGIQPDRADWVLADADGGTPQRFLWLPATDPDAPAVAPDCPRPWTWRPPTVLPPSDPISGLRSLPVCSPAREAIDAARLARLRGDGEALDGHALLTRLKTAAALSILDGRYCVDTDDWDLAGFLSETSERVRSSVVERIRRAGVQRNRARAEAEADRASILADRAEEHAVRRVSRNVARWVAAAGGAGLTRRDLTLKTHSPDRGYLDEACERLVAAGQIRLDQNARGGQSWIFVK